MSMNLEDFRYDAERCTRCKGCMWVDHIYMSGVEFGMKCPSIARYQLDAYSCYGRMRLAIALLDGRLECSPTFLDAVYKCTFCGACDIGCKRNLDLEPLSTLEALRAKCVSDGNGPMPEHRAMAENIDKSHNRLGAPHENRLKWLPENTKVDKTADIVYFVGCNSSYTNAEISQATVKILNAAETNFTVMSDEWCCGYPLFSTGQIEKAKEVAAHNIEAIRKSGAKKVLTSCACCYKTLKVDYPKMFGKSTADMDFEVIHLVEYAAEKVNDGTLSLTNEINKKITYHDPCNLARLSEPWIHWEGERGKYGVLNPPKEYRRGTHGVYEAPREIIKSIPGMKLSEMPRMRENSLCCGAGGGVREAFEDFASWTAGERLKEANSTGVEAIVSCCPRCKENFERSQEENGLEVYDIAEVIVEALSSNETGRSK